MFFLRPTASTLSFLILIFFLSGCGSIPYRHAGHAPLGRAGVPVLTYHHIAELPAHPSRAQQRWTISPKKFAGQMRWLFEHGFHPITIAQLKGYLEHGRPLPVKPVVISFDDGWKDQHLSAFPVLKQYSFPAVFFIIADSVGHSAYMDWDQIQELSDAGMEIGAHTFSHQRLSNLPTEEARREIEDSQRTIEAHLRKPVAVLAYPFGSYSDRVIALAREAGFGLAFTINGLNFGYLFRRDQTYAFPRYAVEGEDELEDIAQLKTAQGPACPAIFVSLVQEPNIFSSREMITDLVDLSRRAGIKTLFVQIYRENKAWFPSRIADASPYEQCLKDLSEDGFALLIREAHRQGIRVYAWLNLLSLSQNQNAPMLKKYGREILTRNLQEKGELRDYLIDRQYFLEPSDPRVRDDLSRVIAEILAVYPDLDGLQLDYIRYPDSEPHYGYTPGNIARFKQVSGSARIDDDSLAWKDWKRGQVTELLASLVKTARGLRPDLEISATGCMSYSRAFHEAYQDWPSWLNQGLVDFVTVMNYSPDPEEFKRWLAEAKGKVSDPSRLMAGIGAYKLEQAPEKFLQELRDAEKMGIKGAVFHYGSMREGSRLKSAVIAKNRRGLSRRSK